VTAVTTSIDRKLPLGVLVSGSGTNLQALLDAVAAGALSADLRLVISNRPEAYALERARAVGVATEVISHREFAGREAFEARLIERLSVAGVGWVALAGFMRVLSPHFLRAYAGRVVNIHPSLLPAFPGMHAQRQALEAGVRVAGATVHLVDEGVDTGPILAQGVVPVLSGDTEESLTRRILTVEHQIYPRALQLIASGRVLVDGRRVSILGDDERVPGPLMFP
jgi:phosphoribosylglycinamide formyltransferase-1